MKVKTGFPAVHHVERGRDMSTPSQRRYVIALLDRLGYGALVNDGYLRLGRLLGVALPIGVGRDVWVGELTYGQTSRLIDLLKEEEDP